MPSECLVMTPPEPESSELEFYRVRDRFVRSYAPATEEERLLVDHMVQAWLHLQSVYEMKQEITARRSLADLFENDFERYKLLNRSVTDAERMWRHAGEAFHRARRRRDPRAPISSVPSFRPDPPPPEPPLPALQNRNPDYKTKRLFKKQNNPLEPGGDLEYDFPNTFVTG